METICVVNFHSNVSMGSLYEVREYLFGVDCLSIAWSSCWRQIMRAGNGRPGSVPPPGPQRTAAFGALAGAASPRLRILRTSALPDSRKT